MKYHKGTPKGPWIVTTEVSRKDAEALAGSRAWDKFQPKVNKIGWGLTLVLLLMSISAIWSHLSPVESPSLSSTIMIPFNVGLILIVILWTFLIWIMYQRSKTRKFLIYKLISYWEENGESLEDKSESKSKR